jgi:hypothetical protein
MPKWFLKPQPHNAEAPCGMGVDCAAKQASLRPTRHSVVGGVSKVTLIKGKHLII